MMQLNRISILNICCWIAICSSAVCAQNIDSKGFFNGETLRYEVRFKWGLINGRAGLAKISTRKLDRNEQWFRELTFRTTGIFNTVYEMRDTMSTLYSSAGIPLRWEKRVMENEYYLIDALQYAYTDRNTVVKSKRYHYDQVKVDTILSASSNKLVLDMLALFGYLRFQDFEVNKRNGQNTYHVYVPIGKELVHCRLYYLGAEKTSTILGKDTDCHKFLLNVADEAFSTKQNVEVWVSNDNRRIPLKVKAKLKIGYALCLLSEIPRY